MEPKCPICNNVKSMELSRRDVDHRIFECPDCGCFEISRAAIAHLEGSEREDVARRNRYAAVMLERKLKGLDELVRLEVDSDEGLYFKATNEPVKAYFPTSFYDKLTRGFFNLVRSHRCSPLTAFSIQRLGHEGKSLLFVDDPYENYNVALDYICEEGWLRKNNLSSLNETCYNFTTKGMQLFEGSLARDSSNAFLAMWFGADGDRAYRDSVSTAVANAGYHLQVVDDEPYNGFIMDKVVNLINDSAFVIADLTAAPESIQGDAVLGGVRGGVYWEAGYAAGQKKQVILTCRDDSETKKRIHFDLQQYNQIRWRVENGRVVVGHDQTLADALEQRILATIGRGREG